MGFPSDGQGPTAQLTSLVFPAFDAGRFLDRTVCQVRQFLREAPGRWELIFVCDGCTDDTVPRLEELAREEPERVRVLSYPVNRGKGYAVRQGLAAARGEWRIFTDVDLAYRFEDILHVARKLQEGAEVVIASRRHPDSRLVLPPRLQGYAFWRHLKSQVFASVVHWLLPLAQADTQAGLKGLSAGAARRVLPALTCDGFGFDCELLTACVCQGLPITEVPVWVRYESTESTISWRALVAMLRDLWRIRQAYLGAVPAEPAAVLPEPWHAAAVPPSGNGGGLLRAA